MLRLPGGYDRRGTVDQQVSIAWATTNPAAYMVRDDGGCVRVAGNSRCYTAVHADHYMLGNELGRGVFQPMLAVR